MPQPVMPQEVVKVITVRLPQSVHAALRRLAYRREKSMNALAVELLTAPLTELLDRQSKVRIVKQEP